MRLINELILTFSAPIKYAKTHFIPMILSRVIKYTTYRQTDRQIDTFIKTVFSYSGGLETRIFNENFGSHSSHKTNTFSSMLRM